jgi:hypothetical protein
MIRDTGGLCWCRYHLRLIHQISVVPTNVSMAMERLGELRTPATPLALAQLGRPRVSCLIGGYCGISVSFSRYPHEKYENVVHGNVLCTH